MARRQLQQHGRRAIVADARRGSRRLLAQLLEDHGFDVTAEVECGTSAMRASQTMLADVLVVDAGERPNDCVRSLWASRERTDAAIILLVPGDTAAVPAAALRALDGVLTHPVDDAALIAALEIALELRARRRHVEQRIDRVQRALCTREIVDEAKAILMSRFGLTERQAYRRIQVRAMETRSTMARVADAIVLAHSETFAVSGTD